MKEKKTLRFSLILLIAASALGLVQTQCRHDNLVSDPVSAKICYDDVETIFLTCSAKVGCHKQGDEGGIALVDYTSIRNSVTPGNAQKSKAYQAITGKGFKQLMPPTGALPESDRILIRNWIDQSASSDTTACKHFN